MQTEMFGTLARQPVTAVRISAGDMSAKLITYGARLTELWVPGRDGSLADVVLGFEDLKSYEESETYFGATCGRYGNRITAGRFLLDGRAIQVDVNEGRNHLHGGKAGFDRKNWNISAVTSNSVTFTAESADGEMGYPGRCNLVSRYTLSEDGGLVIEMEAETDRLTLMNMVHHSYFNLAGQGSGDVLAQQVRLASRFYTPVDDELMPTGEVLSVSGTPYDFRTLTPIGANIGELAGIGGAVFGDGGGYDHNWCLDGAGADMRVAAEAVDPASGRRMVLRTSEPGVQFYTGGYLNEQMTGKAGKRLSKYAGFTLETQKFPDAPNLAHFPGCELRPGETYRQRMVFAFDTVPA